MGALQRRGVHGEGERTIGDDILLLGVPGMVLVPLIVEWLKRQGLDTRWSGLASVAAAGLLAALSEAVVEWPRLEPAARVVLAAVLIGMAGSGAYSQARAFRGHGEA